MGLRPGGVRSIGSRWRSLHFPPFPSLPHLLSSPFPSGVRTSAPPPPSRLRPPPCLQISAPRTALPSPCRRAALGAVPWRVRFSATAASSPGGGERGTSYRAGRGLGSPSLGPDALRRTTDDAAADSAGDCHPG
ncbi:hypothetical protein GUJ93_ZPchr0005g15896 [Zizania palustris]|uniref:Uncharacterized protein n=1 Tax=Zizania palustris TaxID=103762 RepID=A0A8J5T2J9_ZIZPA|nr:hypothetical protein GUJ93_ZPchr0005g15896 [Zizania palustris]